MKQTSKLVAGIYVVVVVLDLFFIYLREDGLRWISKPLLMPLLMLVFYFASKKKTGALFYLILAALFLSWCGDVLLQAKDQFIPGLLSFLLAHVCYIMYFKKAGKHQRGLLHKKPELVLPLLLYIIFLLVFLFPYLQQLKIPVVVYSVTIGVMLLVAIHTSQQLPKRAACFFIAGALLFVVSDSLLAVNLFVVQHWVLGLSVMATYGAAQYLIIKGALEN